MENSSSDPGRTSTSTSSSGGSSPSSEQQEETEGTAFQEEGDKDEGGVTTMTREFLQQEEATNGNLLEEEPPPVPTPSPDGNDSVPLSTPTVASRPQINETTTAGGDTTTTTTTTQQGAQYATSGASRSEQERNKLEAAAVTTATTSQPGAQHAAAAPVAVGNSRSVQERNKLLEEEAGGSGAGGGPRRIGMTMTDMALRASLLPQEMPSLSPTNEGENGNGRLSSTASLPGAVHVDNFNNHTAADTSTLKSRRLTPPTAAAAAAAAPPPPPPPTTITTTTNEESTEIQQEPPPNNTEGNTNDDQSPPSARNSAASTPPTDDDETTTGPPSQSAPQAAAIGTRTEEENDDAEQQQQQQHEEQRQQQQQQQQRQRRQSRRQSYDDDAAKAMRASVTNVVTARLVMEMDEDTEKLQENYRRLQERLMEIENAPTATIVAIPETPPLIEQQQQQQQLEQNRQQQAYQQEQPQTIQKDGDDEEEEDNGEATDHSTRSNKKRFTAPHQQEETTTDGNKLMRHTIIAVVCMILSAVIIVIGILAGTGTFGSSSSSDEITSATAAPAPTPSDAGSVATIATTSTIPPNNNDDNEELQRPTLVRIKERGYIRCTVTANDLSNGYGVSIELCRMLSAAIFDGNTNRTEFYSNMSMQTMWTSIEGGSIDVAPSMVTTTMGRDVYEPFTALPKSFSVPFHYTGVQVAGQPEFVDCVDRRDTLTGVCPSLVVCVRPATTTASVVHEYFDGGAGIHYVDGRSHYELFSNLANGTCNVLAGEPHFIYEDRARDAGYTDEYAHGSFLLSMEPIAMVTREDDTQWTDFSTSVLQALFTAELEGITKENSTLFPETNLFGEDYKTMYQNAIAGVGNWGEVYENTFGRNIERDVVNALKTTNFTAAGGLLYSPPISGVSVDNPHLMDENHPHVVANGTLELINDRGYLRCGILPNRPGFAAENTNGTSDSDWTGMDVGMCRCLASALFADPTLVDFVVLVDQVAAYMALADHLVDVVAGADYSLEADINEENTNQGYSFSPFYFYGEGGEMRSLATNQNSTQWSDFVRWIVYGLIYAEEEEIGKQDASKMPSVDLFGPKYKLMLRLLVNYFGNYGDLYMENLGDLLPRQGSNLLNDGTTPLVNPLPIDQFRR